MSSKCVPYANEVLHFRICCMVQVSFDLCLEMLYDTIDITFQIVNVAI